MGEDACTTQAGRFEFADLGQTRGLIKPSASRLIRSASACFPVLRERQCHIAERNPRPPDALREPLPEPASLRQVSIVGLASATLMLATAPDCRAVSFGVTQVFLKHTQRVIGDCCVCLRRPMRVALVAA